MSDVRYISKMRGDPPARCACGELAPFRLIRGYHGEDADVCEACLKKRQAAALRQRHSPAPDQGGDDEHHDDNDGRA